MNVQNDTTKGILLAFVGVIILSPDSLLVRLIDTPFFTLMFWRGFFMFLVLALFLLYERKKEFVKMCLGLNGPTLVMSVLFAASTFLFVSSLKHTSVAHTLLIVGASPVFTSLFAWILLKEVPQLRIWLAMAVIIFALTLVVQQTEQLVTIKGDVYALLSSILMGYIFVHMRKHKDANQILALSLSGLWTALISLLFTTELVVSLTNGLLLLVLGTIVGIAFSLITLSARYISAPLSSMFMPLETVGGVLLVWLVIGEQPSLMTMIGGLIIIMALLMISFFELKSQISSKY